MNKSLRSVKPLSNGRYEYLRVPAEEAKKLIESKTHIFIGKEEFKRQSNAYVVNSCMGTIVNGVDDKGNKTQECLYNINYTKWMGEQKFPNSTKITKSSMGSGTVKRRNKYGKHKVKPVTEVTKDLNLDINLKSEE